jgi:phytoene dehydrogenase-like protein
MGEIEGVKGAWGYPEGGMGAVSEAIAKSARESGVDIFVNCPVDKVLLDDGKGGTAAKAVGVQLSDGRKLWAKQVCDLPNISNNLAGVSCRTQSII